jgi:hypothetical protein
MAAITPQIPVVNAGLLYVNGLRLSVNATTTLLNVALGQCRDSTDTNDIFVSSNVIVNLANRGINGLDSGTVANSTMYAVYAIGSSANQPFTLHAGQFVGRGATVPTSQDSNFSAFPGGIILSTNFSQPILPAQYDMFRRIGAIVTTNAGAVADFVQTGSGSAREMWYGTHAATSIVGGAATAFAAVGLNAVTPTVPVIATKVLLDVSFTPAAAGDSIALQPIGAPAASVYAGFNGVVAGVVQRETVACPCGLAGAPVTSNINYKVTAGGDAATILVAGYEDIL